MTSPNLNPYTVTPGVGSTYSYVCLSGAHHVRTAACGDTGIKEATRLADLLNAAYQKGNNIPVTVKSPAQCLPFDPVFEGEAFKLR